MSDGGDNLKQRENLEADYLTFIYAFIQQIFAECLLPSEHCSEHYRYDKEQEIDHDSFGAPVKS